MLYLSYYNKIKSTIKHENQNWLAISRGVPPWITSRVEQVIQLAPGYGIFNSYKSGEISFDELMKRYVHQINKSPNAILTIRDIRQRVINGEDIYYICHEVKYTECHRYELAKLTFPNEEEFNEFVILG